MFYYTSNKETFTSEDYLLQTATTDTIYPVQVCKFKVISPGNFVADKMNIGNPISLFSLIPLTESAKLCIQENGIEEYLFLSVQLFSIRISEKGFNYTDFYTWYDNLIYPKIANSDNLKALFLSKLGIFANTYHAYKYLYQDPDMRKARMSLLRSTKPISFRYVRDIEMPYLIDDLAKQSTEVKCFVLNEYLYKVTNHRVDKAIEYIRKIKLLESKYNSWHEVIKVGFNHTRILKYIMQSSEYKSLFKNDRKHYLQIARLLKSPKLYKLRSSFVKNLRKKDRNIARKIIQEVYFDENSGF